MDRQKLFKNKSRNIKYNMDQNKNINNNIEMNVEDFFKEIEKENNDTALYRYIYVGINKDGKKDPTDEHNDWSIEKIKKDRGDNRRKTLSLYVKHIPDLYVIDYDSKVTADGFPIENEQLFFYLKEMNTAHTETKKGFHFYVKIKNIGKYTEQQKIYKDESIDLDLIKTNNIWETRDRVITGKIQEIDWNDIKSFFDIKRMNFEASPPVSPTTSDNDDNDDNDPDYHPSSDDSDEEVFPIIKKKKIDYNELDKVMKAISIEKYATSYDTWIRVGLALHNITDASDMGKGYYKSFSKKDIRYKSKEFNAKWKSFDKNQDGESNKLGMTYLKSLYYELEPKNKYECYKDIFINAYKESNEDINLAYRKMHSAINERLIYVKETGEFIHLSTKLVIKDNGEKSEVPCWYLKKKTTSQDEYSKYIFSFVHLQGTDKETIVNIVPFNTWLKSMDRREVRAIGFDPTDKNNPDIFNIWKGYDISKEIADKSNEEDAKPILDHIFNCWCKKDKKAYKYVLNYLAWIIQYPQRKTGVVLCLRSKQGGGKGVIISKLGEIIGENHFCQNSNANYLFGDFNGQLEGKILVNLDEAFWGGDKKMEGMMKNKITERNQTINKKNKEAYMISCFANYIISTNNEWFAGTTEDDRRYFCLELDNTFSGRMTNEKNEYFKPIVEAPSEAFAKVLYNMDLTNFNPRIFDKTPLLQEQVEMNWCSPKVWWNTVMKEGGFDYDGHFTQWNEVLNGYDFNYGLEIKNKKDNTKKVVYSKEWIYKVYDSKTYNNRKFDNSSFWRELKKNCIGDLFLEKRIPVGNERKYHLFLPTLEEARNKWYDLQQYDYAYGENDDDEWIVDDED